MLSLRDSSVPVGGSLLTHIQAAGSRVSKVLHEVERKEWLEGWVVLERREMQGRSKHFACMYKALK